MHNSNIPTNMELPSTKALIKSTFIAAFVAGVLLVSVVMPAEYGIDKTGIGKLLGLQKMGEIKTSLAEEIAADRKAKMAEESAIPQQTSIDIAPEAIAASQPATNILNHEISVTLAPNEGTEIKVAMSKGSKVQYTWWTDGGKANFDVHGDSKKLKIDYHGYGKGSEQKKSGEIIAEFDGSHGWFWRNRTSETLSVTLQTKGEYTDIKYMK